jgi:SAM-dependent methyltransferase
MSDYSLSPVDASVRDRLQGVATAMDPATSRFLDALGIGHGWACAEIGAGVGSVAVWLADRVGPTGRVVATDLEPRWLDALGRTDIEVRRHDIARERLEASSFDLVHARGVLSHLAQWREALGHMVDSIRPGGWLCLEETDWLTSGLSDPPTPALERFWGAVGELMASTGGDPYLGRKLGTAVKEAGIANVGGEAWVRVSRDGLGTQLDLLGPVLTGAGLITEDEVASARVEAAAPGLTYSPTFVAVWGQRAD